MRPRFTAILISTCALLTSCTGGDDGLQFTGITMGTSYTVELADCSGGVCNSLQQEVDIRLAELTGRLSHYETDSELSNFNRHASTNWLNVSQDLYAVVSYSLQIGELSNGAFDISIASAVNAWGFGPGQPTSAEPTKQLLENTLTHSGYKKIETRASPPAIRKADELLTINLSAVAKGYAVDQLAYLIEARGISDYLIEIGGEIRTAGVRRDGKRWRIGIEPPRDRLGIEYIVSPGDEAIATSGDYRNYYQLDGKKVAHTIDPATARPVNNGLISVSVIAPDAMQADALATALTVMGHDAAIELASETNLAVLLIAETQTGIQTTMSPAFKRYLISD